MVQMPALLSRNGGAKCQHMYRPVPSRWTWKPFCGVSRYFAPILVGLTGKRLNRPATMRFRETTAGKGIPCLSRYANRNEPR